MTDRRTLARLLVVGALAAGSVVASSVPARADFHLIMIREVAPEGPGGVDFVELQMFSSGQTQLDGHEIHTWDNGGTKTSTTLSGNVANGQSQRTILIAASSTVGGQAADYGNLPSSMSSAAGAVCFENIDCVAWGSFASSEPLTSPAAPPAPAPGTDQSLERKINAGCSTALDTADDTNSSAANFAAVTPNPENNSAVPNEALCAGGGGGGGAFSLSNLKTTVKAGRATIRGRVNPSAPGDKVKLTFFANRSPLRKLATKGATLNVESRFKKRFRVPSDSTRCKVVVRFMGSKLGQKRFRC